MTNQEKHFWPPSDPAVVRTELINNTKKGGSTLRTIVISLVLLSLLIMVGIIGKVIIDGNDQTQWGYVAAILAFILSATGGAPMVAIAPLIAKASWARPISRIAHKIGIIIIILTILTDPMI